MRTFLALLLSSIVLLGFARAQTGDAAKEFTEQFQKGIDALNGGKFDEGIAIFKRCLELRPKDATCAYNVGCGHARKGEPDAAFEWLDMAADWGFGNTETNVKHAGEDTDLASLHADARWNPFIEKMNTKRKLGEEYAAKPAAVYIPEALKDSIAMPLLVVLHDNGANKEQVIAGPWKKVADELGFALLAPSGKVMVGADPSAGMAWFGNGDEYIAQYWKFEKPIQDAVSAFKKEHKIDPARVYLSGSGVAGLVAFNVGISGPGLYKGVLVEDSAFAAQLAQSKGPNAGKQGFKARFLLGSDGEWAEGNPPDELAAGLEGVLKKWAVACDVRTYPEAERDAEHVHARRIEALKAMSAPATPVEAGTGK